MRARRVVSAVAGAAVASLLLTGCFKLDGEITVNSDATVSGVQNIELSKQFATMLGITDADSFKKFIEDGGDVEERLSESFGDLGDELFSSTPSAEESEKDDDDEQCPDPKITDVGDGYRVSCEFSNVAAPDESDDWFTVNRVGADIEFVFQQNEDQEDTDMSVFGTAEASAGSVDLVVNLPGAIKEIGGTTPQRVEKVDDDTIRIKGTAMESYDVRVVSAAEGGTNPAPKAASSSSSDDDSSSTCLFIGLGVVVLLVLAGAVAFLVRRGKGGAPAGGAGAAGPGDPSGAAPTA